SHPQYDTHLVRKRVVWVVPVILGERIPQPDCGPEERDRWAQAVLTMFLPWRTPFDIKTEDESWWDAYERQADFIAPSHLSVIQNISVLSECKDARDSSMQQRR
ncbi:hypothetical protein C8Q76DRAFT_600605, partial [Earliella scabrosa]